MALNEAELCFEPDYQAWSRFLCLECGHFQLSSSFLHPMMVPEAGLAAAAAAAGDVVVEVVGDVDVAANEAAEDVLQP